MEKRNDVPISVFQWHWKSVIQPQGPDAPVKMGKGQTIDLSSSGLRFSADRQLVVGQRITVYTDWPFSFGDVKLQHVISGVVVRTIGTEVAIEIRHHDMTIRRVRRQSR
jgi:hypothetical protein